MEIINSKKAPAAIGPFNHAVKKNGMVFVSGTLGFHAETGVLAETFEEQAELVFQHLKNILAEAGLTFANAVKVQIFVKDMGKFPVLNEIYKKNFLEPYPAREVIEVRDLPKGGDVEISLIAIV
ncbi:MAG: Rid family detoxifying hydrolase [Candidatus Cloacimonetes bacterium]|nr:Rid family detoxifying hydrolase [Candidatus Cloacimonadota bacterium]